MAEFYYRSKLVQQVWSQFCCGLEAGQSGKVEKVVKVDAGATVAAKPVIRGVETGFSP